MRRLGSERAQAIAVSVFAALIAVAIALSTWAVIHGYRTDDEVAAISRRVYRLERPTTAREERRILDQAIGRLTPAQARRIIRRAR